MLPKDLFLFLTGNRGAIERVAGSWWSLLIGAILVLSGGIARNYDHLDLLRDPEWIYGPIVASIITSLIVFSFVKIYLRLNKSPKPVKWRQYFSFLCLYWMTAPCAWLYGLPVEAYTDLLTATKWNIVFLVVVSVWRIVLMTRSLTVLTQAGYTASLLAVLFPSAIIMCVGGFFKGLALVGIMGGVRLPPHNDLLRHATEATVFMSFWLAIFTLLFALLFASQLKRARMPLPWRVERPPVSTLVTALVALFVWAGVSYPRQQQVQRNHHLNRLIETEQFSEAVQYASQFEKKDFSTIHFLPPDPYSRKRRYYHLVPHLNGSEPKWLRDTWIHQYAEALLSTQFGIREEEARLIEQIPELRNLVEQRADAELNERLLENLREFRSR